MRQPRRLRAVKPSDALDEAIERFTPEQIACRDYGHAWSPQWATWIPASRCYDTGARCQRCGTMRARVLDERGSQVGNHYTYPDGYLVTGLGRLTGGDRDRIRLASVLIAVDGRQERQHA